MQFGDLLVARRLALGHVYGLADHRVDALLERQNEREIELKLMEGDGQLDEVLRVVEESGQVEGLGKLEASEVVELRVDVAKLLAEYVVLAKAVDGHERGARLQCHAAKAASVLEVELVLARVGHHLFGQTLKIVFTQLANT